MQDIHDNYPSFYKASKEYFCIKKQIVQKRIAKFGENSLEHILDLHEHNKLSTKLSMKEHTKFKVYLSEAYKYKTAKDLDSIQMSRIMGMIDHYFTKRYDMYCI